MPEMCLHNPLGRLNLRFRAAVASLVLFSIVAGLLVLPPGMFPFIASVGAVSQNVVISQVYGGGGNTNASFTHDYVELFNRGNTTVSLTGWSVQYASAAGSGSFSQNGVAAISGDLAPGQYYLVRLATSGQPAPSLPTHDATGNLNLSGAAGKVALVSTTTGLTCNGNSTPCSAAQLAQIVDLVGYGTANFFEGSGAAPGLSNTSAGFRAGNGCTDTDNNSSDFSAGTPAPRNAATQLSPCAVQGPSVSITAEDQNASETGPDNGSFKVFRTGFTNDPLTVHLTVGGTADSSDYGQTPIFVNGAVTIPTGSSFAIFSFVPVDDALFEGSETVTLTLTDTADYNIGTPSTATVTIADNDLPLSRIHDIQGPGAVSPVAGSAVVTEGVVTATKFNGFFLQEPDATADADPQTSEGIFVFTSDLPAVNVGDFVNVSGNVVEFQGLTEISTNNGGVIVTASGNPLPEPVVLTTTILHPAGPVDQLERFEGMRVSAASVRSVAPTNEFGEIYAVLDGVARPFREPGIDITFPVPADPTDNVVEPNIPRWDRNPERIMIDTNALQGSSEVVVTSNVTLDAVAGPLDYNFGDYKIDLETAPTVGPQMSAVPVPGATGSEFSVAGYNIENFTGSAAQTAKAALAIRTVLNLPDVIGLIEIRNLAALQTLAAKVNADVVAAGGSNPGYTAHLVPVPGSSQNVGFLVKSSRVQVDSVTQEQEELLFNGLRLHDRPPLVLHATVNPATDPRPIIAVVNHLRSFIDIEDTATVRLKRRLQAEATAQLLDALQDEGAPVISVGDYNAYEFSDGYTDPIATLKGTPAPDEFIVEDGSPDLVDPDFVNLTETLAPENRYTFIFEGTPQALDHVIVNATAHSILKSYSVARMNADFPDEGNTGNASTPLRNSDHDAPVAIFQFPQRATTTTVPDVTVTYNVSGQSVSLTANVSTSPNTVNEGTVTVKVTDGGGNVVGTAGPAAVSDGAATATFTLPGSVPPQGLTITAEFSGGDTTLPSTGTGTLTVKYAVCELYDPTRAVKSGAAYLIKLQLCDVNGVNVSAPGVTVTATSINLVSAPDTNLEVEDAGNANADSNFRYDTELQGYIFNLKTAGLAPGVHRLNFTAGSDPTVHSVEFRVK